MILVFTVSGTSRSPQFHDHLSGPLPQMYSIFSRCCSIQNCSSICVNCVSSKIHQLFGQKTKFRYQKCSITILLLPMELRSDLISQSTLISTRIFVELSGYKNDILMYFVLMYFVIQSNTSSQRCLN